MRCLSMLCNSFQITRNHYQNALTATRMDSSPQTPDAESQAPGERMTIPETRSNSIALPLTEPRPCLTRFHQHSHLYRQPNITTTLNERNRIVRECIRFSFTASFLGSLALVNIKTVWHESTVSQKSFIWQTVSAHLQRLLIVSEVGSDCITITASHCLRNTKRVVL